MKKVLGFRAPNYGFKMNKIFAILLIPGFLFFYSCSSDQNSNTQIAVESQSVNAELERLNNEIMSGKKDAELYYQRASLFTENQLYENALKDIFIATKLDSLQPKYYILGADLFLNTGQSNSAIQLMEKAESLFPENHKIALKHGEILITLNQLPEAIRKIDHVLYQDNNNPQAFFLMGYIMTIIDDREKAIKALKEAVALDPEIMDAYILLSELYEDEDPQLALQYINNAITVAPDLPQPYHTKAFFLQNNNKEEEALKIYEQIMNQFPSYSAAYLNSGILYFDMDSLPQALDNFNSLINLQPQVPDHYYYRGITYEMMDSTEQAVYNYKIAINMDSTFEEVKVRLDELEVE